MYVQTQFSIFLVNKPGVLASITTALAKAKVNIIALTLMDSMEHGVLRIVCDNHKLAKEILGKTHDRWTETDVLVMEMENKSGVFAKIATHLAKEHVNISYAYCTGGGENGGTTAVFKVADIKKAQRVLSSTNGGKKAKKKTSRTVKPSPNRRR